MAEQTRPPVVTILGHVDHGKTTLLDFIRKTTVAAKEFGGITQAIGAYQAQAEGKTITFIDTPGHAAFEKMRSRGAQLADIAVLVVAVEDGIMPQTIEAIKHIQSANIPMIVAINKIDLPGVNVPVQLEKIKRQLSDNKVLVEEYGGDVPLVSISAKTGEKVQDLLETINLLAEINELKGDPQALAVGVIIESRLDKFRGPLATVLVRDGSLQKGDQITVGEAAGKVRGMFDFAGKAVDVAGPSMPVEVLGFVNVPSVGARLGEQKAKSEKEKSQKDSFLDKLRQSDTQTLPVVVRADNQGSLEAIEDIVNKLNENEQHLKIVSSGTGDIIDSDVEMAATSKAIVLGFNVKTAPVARKIADANHVLIRDYHVIYELMEELQDVIEGVLQPGVTEEVFGRAQIIAEFPFGKNEKIAGCQVIEGTISKGPKVRVVRGGEVVEEGKIKSLRKVKDEVSKVEKGQECGIIFDGVIQFQVGDLVESYRNL